MRRLAVGAVLLLGACANWEALEQGATCRANNTCDGGAGGTGGGTAGGTGGGTAGGTGGGTAGGTGGGTAGGSGGSGGSGGGTAGGGGGTAGGSGGGSGGGGGTAGGGGTVVVVFDGGIDALPLTPSTGVLHTNPQLPAVRTPVFLWQTTNNLAVVVETWDGGVAIWRLPDSFPVGNFDGQPTYFQVGAVREGSPILAISLAAAGGQKVNADTFDGGVLVRNKDFPLTAEPIALAQYERPDGGGTTFLAIGRSAPNQVFYERSACPTSGCFNFAEGTLNLTGALVYEAAVDQAQTTWVSVGMLALELRADESQPIQHVLGDAGTPRVELASSGARVTAAWVENNNTLVVAPVAGGGVTRTFVFAEPARLVDLVRNQTFAVAVLEFAGPKTVLVVADDLGASVTRFASAVGFSFRPRVVHLGFELRIAGQCLFPDGGEGGDVDAGCQASNRNPVLRLANRPGGGPW